jgi:hypothetical protein
MELVLALVRFYRFCNELLKKCPAGLTTPRQFSWVTPQDLLKGVSSRVVVGIIYARGISVTYFTVG